MERDASPAAAAPKDRAAGHGRALTKAITWRILGTLDTFIWSLVVTHHPMAAGAIASLETFTKILLYYLHERGWRVLKWAPHSRLRSFTKAVSWRFIGTLDTFTLSLIVTGSAKYAVSIASLEALSKIVLYYLHERGWRAVRWGRLETPPAETSAPVTIIEPGSERAESRN